MRDEPVTSTEELPCSPPRGRPLPRDAPNRLLSLASAIFPKSQSELRSSEETSHMLVHHKSSSAIEDLRKLWVSPVANVFVRFPTIPRSHFLAMSKYSCHLYIAYSPQSFQLVFSWSIEREKACSTLADSSQMRTSPQQPCLNYSMLATHCCLFTQKNKFSERERGRKTLKKT